MDSALKISPFPNRLCLAPDGIWQEPFIKKHLLQDSTNKFQKNAQPIENTGIYTNCIESYSD